MDQLLAWNNGTFSFKRAPLNKCRITQPFGVDYINGSTYKGFGLKGHNGIDLSSPTGNEVFAVDDGFIDVRGNYTDSTGYGLNARLYIYFADNIRLECVYAHLKEVLKTDDVKAGDLIAYSDNSGFSTAPHLHFGVRLEVLTKNGWEAQNGNNGYFGSLDPQKYFDPNIFKLPVELQYGLTAKNPLVPSELQWYATNVWFLKTFKRLMTPIERNALRFGFWDVRTVTDPTAFHIWSEYSKPAALKAGLIK